MFPSQDEIQRARRGVPEGLTYRDEEAGFRRRQMAELKEMSRRHRDEQQATANAILAATAEVMKLPVDRLLRDDYCRHLALELGHAAGQRHRT